MISFFRHKVTFYNDVTFIIIILRYISKFRCYVILNDHVCRTVCML